MMDPTKADRSQFDSDPAGYSQSAWMRWEMIAAMHGGDVEPDGAPTSSDLKQPILWLAQAEALTQAAIALLRHEPAFERMPAPIRGVCDSQYCAVGLMLVGYSLEVCLKAMLIMRVGPTAYAGDERSTMHHRLHDLAGFMDHLSAKDLAVLEVLTQFVSWAGRYPDPGSKFIAKRELIFELSETYSVTARDIFDVAARVMSHLRLMTRSTDEA